MPPKKEPENNNVSETHNENTGASYRGQDTVSYLHMMTKLLQRRELAENMPRLLELLTKYEESNLSWNNLLEAENEPSTKNTASSQGHTALNIDHPVCLFLQNNDPQAALEYLAHGSNKTFTKEDVRAICTTFTTQSHCASPEKLSLYKALLGNFHSQRSNTGLQFFWETLLPMAFQENTTWIMKDIMSCAYWKENDVMRSMRSALTALASTNDTATQSKIREALCKLVYEGLPYSLLGDEVREQPLYSDIFGGMTVLQHMCDGFVDLVAEKLRQPDPIYFGVCDKQGENIFSLIAKSPHKSLYITSLKEGGRKNPLFTLILMGVADEKDVSMPLKLEFMKVFGRYRQVLQYLQFSFEGRWAELPQAIEATSFCQVDIPESDVADYDAVRAMTIWLTIQGIRNEGRPLSSPFPKENAEFLSFFFDMMQGGAAHEKNYREISKFTLSPLITVEKWQKELFPLAITEAALRHIEQNGLISIKAVIEKWLKEATPAERMTLALAYIYQNQAWTVRYNAEKQLFSFDIQDIKVAFVQKEMDEALKDCNDNGFKFHVVKKLPIASWPLIMPSILSEVGQRSFTKKRFSKGQNTPLHEAARAQAFETVEYLVVALGADIDAKNADEKTAFEESLLASHVDMAKCLAKLGAIISQDVENVKKPIDRQKILNCVAEIKVDFTNYYWEQAVKPENLDSKALEITKRRAEKLLKSPFCSTLPNPYSQNEADKLFASTVISALNAYLEGITKPDGKAITAHYDFKEVIKSAKATYCETMHKGGKIDHVSFMGRGMF